MASVDGEGTASEELKHTRNEKVVINALRMILEDIEDNGIGKDQGIVIKITRNGMSITTDSSSEKPPAGFVPRTQAK